MDATIARSGNGNGIEPQFSHMQQPVQQPVSYPVAPDIQSYKSACTANSHFANKDYKRAIREYTKAIARTRLQLEYGRANDFCALLYSNRSASYLQLGQYEEALRDGQAVVNINNAWAKGYFRMAEAMSSMGQYRDAVNAYSLAQEREPNNHEISERLLRARAKHGERELGIEIYSLLPGRDIANKNRPYLAPIKTRIFAYAAQMKNLIHVIVDTETRHCIVIDAAWDVDGILAFLRQKSLILKGCIVTHAHFDHTCGKPPPPFDQLNIKVPGVATVAEMIPNVQVYVNPQDWPLLRESNPGLVPDPEPISEPPDSRSRSRSLATLIPRARKVSLTKSLNNVGSPPAPLQEIDTPKSPNMSPTSSRPASRSLLSSFGRKRPNQLVATPDGFTMTLGRKTHLRFIHAPGHTPGSQCILVNECRLFSGDVLLCSGMTGRTDLEHGDSVVMLNTLKFRFKDLDDDVVMYPGHEYATSISTIGIERQAGTIGPYRGGTENDIMEDIEEEHASAMPTPFGTMRSTPFGTMRSRIGGLKLDESSDEEFPSRASRTMSVSTSPNFLPPEGMFSQHVGDAFATESNASINTEPVEDPQSVENNSPLVIMGQAITREKSPVPEGTMAEQKNGDITTDAATNGDSTSNRQEFINDLENSRSRHTKDPQPDSPLFAYVRQDADSGIDSGVNSGTGSEVTSLNGQTQTEADLNRPMTASPLPNHKKEKRKKRLSMPLLTRRLFSFRSP